jgi:hypothetical protein
MTPTFSVKDFDKFQHYKDRAPPWIKLYNSTLDSYEFAKLSDAARFHLLAIMLLASRSGNKIPYDPVWVSGRINSTEPVQLDVLVDAGFLELNQPLQALGHVASTMQAKRLSRGEKRREEGERENKDAAPAVKLKNHMLAKGKPLSAARAAVETASSTSDPKEYIGGILRGHGTNSPNGRPPDKPGMVWGDDYM